MQVPFPSPRLFGPAWRGPTLAVLAFMASIGPAACHAPGDGRAATNVVPQPEPPATTGAPAADEPPAPIEVLETTDYDGRVVSRAEGYRDENGKFVYHGTFTTYHDNGLPKREEHYVHGVTHGERTSWYENGQISGQGYYDHGRETGIWSAWWPNGFKQQEFEILDGTWHGTHTSWHVNGEKRMEQHYVNGLRQGSFVIWDDQGNEVYRSEFLNDVEQP
jgi:hypothetical protein